MHAEGKAMMERGLLKAMHRLANPDAKAERYVFLSFADGNRPAGSQNLGCTLVVADDLAEAVAASHLLKINPGGSVRGTEIADDGTMDPKAVAFFLNTLRTRSEAEAAGFGMRDD